MVAIESSNGGVAPETSASTPAETGAVSGQIQITIEAIRKIARDNMAQMRDNATERSSDFVGLSLSPGAFSAVPFAQAVGRQHQAAHEVFTSTIEGVIADLEAFAANLEASCAAHEAADEQSAMDAQRAGQGALTTVSTTMGDYQYRSDENFEAAGAERRDDLGEATHAEPHAGGETSPGTPGEQAGAEQADQDAAGAPVDSAGFDGDSGAAGPVGADSTDGTGSAGFDGDTSDGAR